MWHDLKFEALWKAWVEIEGNPKLPVPAYANPRSLRLDQDCLWMELAPCPETSALLQGFKYEQGTNFVGNFECTLSTISGTLKTASGSSGYSIDAKDLEDAEFSAYIVVSGGKDAVSLAIVPEITGSNQVKLLPNNRIEASPNLVGQTVKVQVRYPQVVMMAEEAIDTLYVHLLGAWEDGSTYYVGITGCLMEVSGKILKLRSGAIERRQQLSSQICSIEKG